MSRFTFNPAPFNPNDFGNSLNSPQDLSAFNPSQFTTNTPGSSFAEFNFPNQRSVDTSNIGFGQNNTPQFGANGAGFDSANPSSSGLSGLDIGRLGIGALNVGSGIFDSILRRKNLKLARDAFNFKQDAFNKNFGLAKAGFDNRVTLVNNRINDQNAFKTAQGRTDLAKLVV